MNSVQYGNTQIGYEFRRNDSLKSHYVTVEKGKNVLLKGKPLSREMADRLILKKARWIIEKRALVATQQEDAIVTGSRVQYLGRRYYVEIRIDNSRSDVEIEFTESKFRIYLPESMHTQACLQEALGEYLRSRAVEKITERVKKWSQHTGLLYKSIRFNSNGKRWGSCTPGNMLLFNYNAIRLPYSLIDYLVVHELVHTKVKDHSKKFRQEVGKIMPDWKIRDEKMSGMGF